MFTMIVYSKNKLHEIDYFLIILRQNYIIFLNKNDLLLFLLYYFFVFENKNIQGENMDRHFFSTSSDFLNEQLQNDIFSYIKENEL